MWRMGLVSEYEWSVEWTGLITVVYLGWVFPFIWSGVMVAITIKWVQRDLRAEREEWETADVGVLRGYQL